MTIVNRCREMSDLYEFEPVIGWKDRRGKVSMITEREGAMRRVWGRKDCKEEVNFHLHLPHVFPERTFFLRLAIYEHSSLHHSCVLPP